MASWERLIPLARMMLFSLYQDDVYERATPQVVRVVRERTVAVARGHVTARRADIMLGAQVETLRGELLRFLPAASVDRWADDLDLYSEGLEAEVAHLEAGTFPTVEEFLRIRERALMLHAFPALKAVETGVVLPGEIHGHPTIRRLKSLAVRLPGWFNEFQSYDKDQRTGMGNLNLVNVVRRERSCSLEDARERVFRLHEDDLDEFVRLQRNLPDFRAWHDAAANHIHHVGVVVSGWRGVDAKISPPVSVFRHPVVQRLRSLTSRLMSVQNDLHSLAKEEARPSECVNIVPVLRRELECTRDEAITEAVRILDSFSAEILALGRCLPDFGPHQGRVRECFRQMQLMVTGLERWYRHSRSTRHRIPGAFPDIAPDPCRRP